MKLDVFSLPLQGIKLVRSARMSDARGYFAETYVRRDFLAAGIEHEFIQDNESRSHAAGTVRGLHFQVPPFAQTKLVRVLRGRIHDVVVDLRRSSPTYGKHLAVELDETTGDQLLDCSPAICRVGASERTGRPERCFAGPSPQLEVGHPGQSADVSG